MRFVVVRVVVAKMGSVLANEQMLDYKTCPRSFLFKPIAKSSKPAPISETLTPYINLLALFIRDISPRRHLGNMHEAVHLRAMCRWELFLAAQIPQLAA